MSPRADRALAAAAYLIGLAAGVGLLVSFGFTAIWERGIPDGDFSAIWAGPHVLVSGGDPYDPTTWRRATEVLGVQAPGAAVYVYPGWVAVLLAPLGALDLRTAALVWTTIGVLAAAVGLFVLLDTTARRHRLVLTILAFLLLGSESGIVAFYAGQTDFALVAGLALMAAWLWTGRQAPAGVAAAVMLLKPQLFVLAIPAVARLSLARRERTFLRSFVASALALAALSTVFVPQWWAAWLANVPMTRATDARAATLPNAMRDLLGDPGVLAAYGMLAATIAAAFAFSPRSRAALAVWLTVSMSVAPYMWVYDHVVGIVPLALAAAINGRASALGAIVVASGGLLILAVGATLLHALPGVERGTLSFNGLAQFALSVWIVVTLWRFRSAPTDEQAAPAAP